MSMIDDDGSRFCDECGAEMDIDVARCTPGEFPYKPCACGGKGIRPKLDKYVPMAGKKGARPATARRA